MTGGRSADIVVDVVVVGAGIAGVSVAAELAARCSVVLVEREALPAQHATGRSAALLNETVGHPAVCALARASRAFFEQPPDGFGDHPLLSPRGLLWVGEAGDAEALDQLAGGDPRLQRLDPVQVRTLLTSAGEAAIAGGGVLEADARTIDVAALVAGYLRLLRHRGGEVHTTSEAVRAERHGTGWVVTAGAHRVPAGAVVNAAGGWVDVVAARSGVPALGVHVLRRSAAIARTDAAVGGWPMVMDVAGRYYFEPEAGGLLVSPADEQPTEPCDAQADEVDVAIALDRVREASGLPLRSIVRAWAGLRTFAPDRAPLLGDDPAAPGFWWLAGQGGAGIKTAPAMAAVLAALVAGDRTGAARAAGGLDPAAWSPARFR